MVRLLQVAFKRIRLGLKTMIWGVAGFSDELGRQIRRDVMRDTSSPALLEMCLRSISLYIYIRSLSKALGVSEDQLLNTAVRMMGSLDRPEPRRDSTMYI